MNCGTLYQPDRECPNTHDGKHTVERATQIASYLIRHGALTPRPLDVRDAAASIDALGRK